MAIPSWPTANNFPQTPQKGFSESLGMNIIRSQTDKGPAKQRRRTVSPNTMDVTFILTTQQTTILESFVDNDIMGVRRFNFWHPRRNVPVEVRIVPQGEELYKLQYLAPGYWQASFKFEILP